MKWKKEENPHILVTSVDHKYQERGRVVRERRLGAKRPQETAPLTSNRTIRKNRRSEDTDLAANGPLQLDKLLVGYHCQGQNEERKTNLRLYSYATR